LPFNRLLTEAWYEKSRKRLFDIIGKTKKSGVMLLSGDVHFAEISKTFCTLPEVGYDLFEITSSGMTHYVPKTLCDIVLNNDYQVTDSVHDYNFAKFEFDWGSKRDDSSVVVKIIDIENVVRTHMKFRYKELVWNKNKIVDEGCNRRIKRRFKELNEYVSYYKQNFLELVLMLGFYLLILMILFSMVYMSVKMILYVCRKVFRAKKKEKIE
jgi:hypothetical protein